MYRLVPHGEGGANRYIAALHRLMQRGCLVAEYVD